MKRGTCGLLLLLAFLLASPAVGAQPDGGAIYGTIVDEAGAVLPGVTVTVFHLERGTHRKNVTNERGLYRVAGLEIGTYVLTAELAGFAAYRREGIEVRSGREKRIDVVLRIAGVTETVTVTGEAPPIHSQRMVAASPLVAAPPDWRLPPPGQGFHTEAYDRITDNPFRSVLDHPLSTFSIDVDRASYSNTRRFLNEYRLPPKDAVRIEELVNYFEYDYPDPEGDAPFGVTLEQNGVPVEAGASPRADRPRGKEDGPGERPPTNLVFLLDVSGSMTDENKLPLVKRSLKMLTAQLTATDRVAIVVYAGASGLVLDSTPGSAKGTILDALDRLEAGGSTNGGEGLKLAYDVAVRGFIDGGVNRVILATDGDFNVGVTSEGELVRLIEESAKKNVFLSVLGFGMGNYKDATLEKLADRGNGNYAYIDGLPEARKVLVDEISGTLVVIAKDVKIQVELNPSRVSAYRLIGYENRLLAKEDFNDDTKDAGEIGAGHRVTALYELVPAGVKKELVSVDPLKYQRTVALRDDALSKELLTVKIRYKDPDGEADTSKLLGFVLEDDGRAKASRDFRFAAAVAAFGMMLRESPYRGNAEWDGVEKLARAGLGEDPDGHRRQFLDLVDLAREVSELERREERR